MENTLQIENQTTVQVTRTLDMPLEKVWQAFSESKYFKKWWSPEGFICPYSSINFKTGGKYLHCMRSSEGPIFWTTGNFEEIIPHKKIVCTDHFSDPKGNIVPAADLGIPGEWPEELLLTINFKEKSDKTVISLQYDGVPEELYEDYVSAWQHSLNRLNNLLL